MSPHAKPSPSRDAITALLQAHGPMTIQEIADALDWPHTRAHAAVQNARRLHPGRVFHVAGFRAPDGKGKYASAYGAGPGADVARPRNQSKSRRRSAQKRYRAKHKALINARQRLKRAPRDRPIAINPWAALAPREVRAHMTIQVR